jgi:hypothetical protein
MKTIAFHRADYDSYRTYIVELSDYEARRILTDEAVRHLQRECFLGREFDLASKFEQQDKNAAKARQLDALMDSIGRSRDLVFPPEEKKPEAP